MTPSYTRLDEKWVVLTQDLHYHFTLASLFDGNPGALRNILSATGLKDTEDLVITAPSGFVTDLASVPESLRFVFSPEGTHSAAAILHDILYQNNQKSQYADDPVGKLNSLAGKYFADRMFLIAMRSCGVNAVKRTLFYNAVSLFGDAAYEDLNLNVTYPVPPKMIFRMAEPYYFIRKREEAGIPISHRQTVKGKEAHTQYPNLKRAIICS